MIFNIRVQTTCAKQAVQVLKAAERAAKKLGLPEPVGTFEQSPVPTGPPPPVCGPDEQC